MLLRTLFYCLPAVLIGLTLWSVEQIKASRALRQGDLVALMSERQTPALNPYQPASEAERQLVDLIHEPLIRLTPDGRLGPGLARQWRWLKRVTAWFADGPSATAARQRLHQAQSQWPAWHLGYAKAEGRTLELSFTDPLQGSVRDALRTASARVQAVSIFRIDAQNLADKAHLAIVSNPVLSSPVQRWWMNDSNGLELAVAGADPDYQPALQRHLERSLPEGATVSVRLVSSLPVLEEPVLEFILRDDARWHDGTPVTGNDVRATWESISSRGWSLPNAEGFRMIRAVESPSPSHVHIVFWRHYGPALCAWIGLPILPAGWLKDHPVDNLGRVFLQAMPQGAGPCKIEHRDYSSLVVRPVQSQPDNVRRLTLVTSLSSFSSQLGYRTRSLDMFWPHAEALVETPDDEPLTTRPTPPRSVVQLTFNTRRDPLQNPLVRQALASAIDRRVLVATAAAGVATPHASLFAPGLWLSVQPQIPAGDPQLAEQKLASAGWLRNAAGTAASIRGALVFKLLTPDDDARLLRLALALRVQWARLGIQVVVQSLPRSTLMGLLSQGSYDAALDDSVPPVSWDLTAAWHSQSSANTTGYASRPIDLLLEGLVQEFDSNEAAIRTRRLESLILADCPVIPLATLHENTMLRASLDKSGDRATPWTLRSLLGTP